MNAILITIGDEILNGDITDTNASYISRQLGLIGIRVQQRLTVADKREDILDAFQYAKEKSDLVLITGGLGPTQDDLTKECFAEFFKTPLVKNQALFQKIQAYYQSRGKSIDLINDKMIQLPEGCLVLENNYGVAPAMWQKKDNCTLIALPGVPFEMRGILKDEVIPKLMQTYCLPYIHSHYFNTIGQGEVVLEKRLTSLIEQLPSNLQIAFLPSFSNVTIRLTGSGNDQQHLINQFDKYVPLFCSELKDVLYSEVKNETITHALAKCCLKNQYTISTAESCTGGSIAANIVSLAGSSAYFKGSVIAYENEVKQSVLGVAKETLVKYGAVSEQTVQEMVCGVLKQTGSDFAVATSGIAGPTGGTEEKPVGRICIAVGNEQVIKSKTFTFAKNREKNIQIFTTTALNMLLKFIEEEQK